MHADFELDPDGETRPAHGGRRAGAGRPAGYSPKRAAELAEGDGGAMGDDRTSLSVRKARAVAEKAEWDAKQAALDYKKDSKEYLSRSAFREATATLLAELAQGLRSIPDTLERKHGLPAEIVQSIERTIDERMQAVAESLELFTGAAE